MCNVNYLIEIRRFNTFAARTRLPASAQLLWYKLIEIMNQHARGGDWCDGFLRIDNPYLLAYFPMSATALADARRTLCEAGLLEYIPGEKKRTPPAYRLHYFSVCDGKGAVERDYPREIGADSTADCPSDCHEIRDYPRDHPDFPAANLPQLLDRHAQEIRPVKQRQPPFDHRRRTLQQSQQAQRRHRLAASRFPHQPQHLAPPDFERHPVHGAQESRRGLEPHSQFLDT